jgi:UDP:flavonoid glycosyltransferase YjiC (YdhE family)
MGTGVFFNLPAYGHVNPTLPVVRNLVARGERILYFDTPEFKEKIEAAGADSGDIRAAARMLLGGRNFYENARKVSDSFKASGGYERGAELILRYVFPR